METFLDVCPLGTNILLYWLYVCHSVSWLTSFTEITTNLGISSNSSSRTKDFPKLFNFSKEVSRLTKCQTYNKYKGIFEPRVQPSRNVYTKFCSIPSKDNKKYYEFKLNGYRRARHRQTNRPGPRDDSIKGGSPKETFTLISHDGQ